MTPRAIALAAAALAAAASAPAAEVVVLKSSEVPAWQPTIDALRRGATGHTLTEVDLKNDRGEADRVLTGLKGKPVIVVALGPLAAQAAHEVLPETLLIFGMVQDPGRLGLLTAPNTTGVSFTIPVMNQLAAFRMVNPRGVRIGVLYNPENTGRQVQEAQKATPLVHLALVDRPVSSERDIPEALRSLLRGPDAVDALWLPADPLLLNDLTRRFILSETLKAMKPVYSFSSALVMEGALASDGPDLVSIGEQLAELVQRLAGDRAARIPMMVPRAELVINKKMADKLKIDVPQSALRAANRVF
ncbi:MAG TPA: ABC transporter substrate-binding protein [Vicinamibacteria bacterium]